MQGDRVQFHYYRLWWPGNGTVFLGHGISQQTYQTERQYKNFDLAATLFQTPYNVPIPRSIWNHLGLWWVNKPAPINQWWIGLPSFLPVLIVLLFIYYLRCT
ncbi:MAG: hypothetical protein CR991_01805 [Proteobacteria bacterium]|nr:MAG: hypothetical protein CR991_01805 [Pseudomonadota bacterium]